MAQRSMLNFFSRGAAPAIKKSTAAAAATVGSVSKSPVKQPLVEANKMEDSPVKQAEGKKRKNRIVSDSSDEENAANTKSSSKPPSEKISRVSHSPATVQAGSATSTPDEMVKTPAQKKAPAKSSRKSTSKTKKETPKTSQKSQSKAIPSVSMDDPESTTESPKSNNEKADIKPESPKGSSESTKKATPNEAAPKSTPKAAAAPAMNAAPVVSGIDYSPSDESYRPVTDAFWKEGEAMPYLALAMAFKQIEEEPSRLKITLTLCNLFRSAIRLSPKDLISCVYLSINKLGPAYEAHELGIGESLLIKALAQATGRNADKIKEDLQSEGDIGIVAEQSRTSQKTLFTPARLTIKTVFDRLKLISEMSGHSVMTKKIEKIRSILVACQHCEARYVLRTLGGKLRIGLADQTVLTALGQAFASMQHDSQHDLAYARIPDIKKRSEEVVYKVKSVYCEHPNLDDIISAVLTHGIDQLETHCKLTPGIPLKPMLAHPAKGVKDILARLDSKGAFTSEYKYDGERAQIHILEDKSVKIFSRNQEDNSGKYPDIIKICPDIVVPGVSSCIIDSEIVAWDTEKGSILPFQVLTTRKRKDVSEENIKVQVCIYAFDFLYLNGESLVKKSLRERRKLLFESLKELEGKLKFVNYSDSNDTDEIAHFLEESIKGNCEGLMIKTLDSFASYEIARRSHNWLKLKKDYLEGIGDTLDLVVMGGYMGKGKRSGVFGGFLLACYDPESEEYQSICKIGTGFSELQLTTLNAQFQDNTLPHAPTYYSFDPTLAPDVWFEPIQVWEVKAADLSLSPIHRAAMGLVESSKGISLRFPRFVRIREDKSPEQATAARQVATMYKSQDQIKNQETSAADVEDDFY